MRILSIGNLYPPHHLGGYELVWQAAVRALRDAGHEVRVLTTAERLPGVGAPDDDPDLHRELRWYWHDHRFPPLPLRERVRLERHNQRVLARHLAEQRTELVSWWAMGGMSLSLIEAVRRAGLPALGWVNDDWLIYAPDVDQWMRGRARRLLGPAVDVPGSVDLGGAARWIFCSDAIRRSALRVRPELRDTGFLHQGVAADFTAAPEQPWHGRLLYAGRLDERKGVGALVDAVAALEDVTLRIVGDGDPGYATELRERIAGHGLGDRVTLEPGVPRDELARRYAEADAVVFPVEWFEPWGLIPLESMATGRPVIATGQGGSAEYLEDEVNALLYPPGDAAALAAAIRRLAGDPELRARLREGGLATAARLTERGWTDAVVREHESRARRVVP